MNELLNNYTPEIETILAKYPPERKRSAVIPLLYLAQQKAGAVTGQAIREIAEIIDVTPTEVASIVGFYSLFHEEGGGRYRIQVCTDLPCALRGADEFLHQLCERLGVVVGGTTSDGLFTVEEVTCLAACDKAPMFQLQVRGPVAYHEHQSVETALQVVEEIRRQAQENVPAGKEATP